ncbi:hypothetical protein [Parachryseolinea silvisoli]|uniref:hypothetical protein n=1 Tax=Parachryseolinea silvisoli TaxID=2873601 RepID=UPI002265D4F4|nr:hypothetical protein [Parachryseolinea silvisoli]MCD9019954.1 hypothetical protein [Parachryseolinea silvisoli]
MIANKSLTRLTIISLCVAIGFCALYVSSPLSTELTPSSFNRSFKNKNYLEYNSHIDLDNAFYYISGVDKNSIYLSNYKKPFTLVQIDHLLKQFKTIKLKTTRLDSIFEPRNFRTTIDSPNIFMTHGTMPIILRGDLKNHTVSPFMSDKNIFFTEARPITDSTFALLSYSAKSKALQLGFLDISSDTKLTFRYGLLKTKSDETFSVYGTILLSTDKNKIIYIYTYKNEILIADTKLQNEYILNTIDTFKTPPITVSKVSDKSKFMLSSPQILVNGISCTSGDYIYIRSNLLAKNENKKNFIDNSTIDVYNVSSKKYEFSFYIPKHNSKEFIDYKIINEKIYALYEDRMIKYQINDITLIKNQTSKQSSPKQQ